jgi:hypothetical protein
VVEQQGPALTGSSQATAVEIPDDDAPPPEWDQWANLPTPAPEPQVGALVRRWDGHMVAGSSRHGAEASSSRTGRPASSDPAASLGQGQERIDAPPPHFADAQEKQQLWEELRGHGASLNRVLNEALRIHGDPACHPGASAPVNLSISSLLCCFRVCLYGATLIGPYLLVAGVGAPCPRQVRRL